MEKLDSETGQVVVLAAKSKKTKCGNKQLKMIMMKNNNPVINVDLRGRSWTEKSVTRSDLCVS